MDYKKTLKNLILTTSLLLTPLSAEKTPKNLEKMTHYREKIEKQIFCL